MRRAGHELPIRRPRSGSSTGESGGLTAGSTRRLSKWVGTDPAGVVAPVVTNLTAWDGHDGIRLSRLVEVRVSRLLTP